MLRIRFQANLEDPRPVNWPIKYPYWVTGSGWDHSTVVAYAPDEEYIYHNWPEAGNLDIAEADEILFTSRFQQPDWYDPASNPEICHQTID